MKIAVVGGMIVDGTGSPWFYSNIYISDGIISKIGHEWEERPEVVIDASGQVVCPGFIDMHGHSDYSLLVNPFAESKVRQGVTTEVIGQCGFSLAPINDWSAEYLEKTMPDHIKGHVSVDWRTMDEYLNKLEERRTSINVVPFIGHGTVRMNVLRFENREPTEEELEEMKGYVREGMEAGAFGLSTGLIYPPSSYAKTEEIVELCKVVAEYKGMYASHIRGESDTLIEAVKEAIEIGEKSGCRVEISHFKASGKRNWGKTKVTCRIVEEARERGVEVAFDFYPYTASSTGLDVLLPQWALEGGVEAMLRRLRDPEARREIRSYMEDRVRRGKYADKEVYDIIRITDFAPNRGIQGKTVAEISKEWGLDPYETVFELLLRSEGRVGIIIHGMNEEDLLRVMRHPLSCVGSDSSCYAKYGPLSETRPHPRAYGTFARVLGYYSRERKILTMEEAIRKMTSAPASRLRLFRRGLIREGFHADLVVFDPRKVIDKATYLDPHQYAEGINYVLVNGEIVVEKGEHTKARPGKVLRFSK